MAPDKHLKLQFSERAVGVTGGVLAGVGGFVNAWTLCAAATPVSHTTGNVSKLGLFLAERDLADASSLVRLLACFLLGAIASGIITADAHLKLAPRYSVALLLEGALLALASQQVTADVQDTLALCAAACGLQNGMAASYRGVVLRTTHTTGIMTDLGVFLGHLIRGQHVEWWRFLILASLLAGYATGGLMGALAWQLFGATALLAGALVCGGGGVGLLVWMRWKAFQARSPGV